MKNTVANMEKFNDLIKKKGFRLTSPRKAIVEYLLRTNEHPDIQQIFEGVAKNNPGIGIATVYRTVELLTGLGLLHVIVLNDGRVRYEISLPHNHHHHLICTTCGRITEFGNCNFDRMVKDIEKSTRFKINSHNLEAYGICPHCYE